MSSKKTVTGLMVIVLGVFLLLMNLGYMDVSLLWRIWNIWPLLLVVIGVNILSKGRSVVRYISWILFLIIVIVYGVYIQNNYFPIERTRENYNIEVEKPIETKYGHLDLDIGAAQLMINPEDYYLLTRDINGRGLDYKEDYKDDNQTAMISLKSSRFQGKDILNSDMSYYDFSLNKNILWELDLDLGAVSGEMNLKDIPVQSIDLDFGAGSLDIILGSKSSELDLHIDAGASNLNIIIPKGAGIKVKMDTALTKTNLDNLDLKKEGDYYISLDYENADSKIKFDIDMGAGKINFERE